MVGSPPIHYTWIWLNEQDTASYEFPFLEEVYAPSEAPKIEYVPRNDTGL